MIKPSHYLSVLELCRSHDHTTELEVKCSGSCTYLIGKHVLRGVQSSIFCDFRVLGGRALNRAELIPGEWKFLENNLPPEIGKLIVEEYAIINGPFIDGEASEKLLIKAHSVKNTQ